MGTAPLKERGLKSTLLNDEKDRDELAYEIMRRVETWLDQGMGSCSLKEKEAGRIITEAMHAADGVRYDLGCYAVMPNHVHAALRPLDPVNDPLERILQRWKGGSSCLINKLLQRSGAFWQRDSFDRIVRDEEHLWRVIQYVGANPGKAGLSLETAPLWIRPEWAALGWRFL